MKHRFRTDRRQQSCFNLATASSGDPLVRQFRRQVEGDGVQSGMTPTLGLGKHWPQKYLSALGEGNAKYERLAKATLPQTVGSEVDQAYQRFYLLERKRALAEEWAQYRVTSD
jgi:hypothetical protein